MSMRVYALSSGTACAVHTCPLVVMYMLDRFPCMGTVGTAAEVVTYGTLDATDSRASLKDRVKKAHGNVDVCCAGLSYTVTYGCEGGF